MQGYTVCSHRSRRSVIHTVTVDSRDSVAASVTATKGVGTDTRAGKSAVAATTATAVTSTSATTTGVAAAAAAAATTSR